MLRLLTATLGLCLALGLPAPAAAAPADSLRVGAWGAFPPPSDSTLAEFRPAPRPAWEWALDAPYQLAKLPFAVLRLGVREAVIWADESGAVRLAQRILGPYALPGGLMLEFEADGLGGLGVGVDIRDRASRGRRLRAALRQSLNAGNEARLSLRLGEAPRTLILVGGTSNRPDQAFYGLGPFAEADDESEFTQELHWGGLALEAGLPGGFAAELSGIYSDLGSRDRGDDGAPFADLSTARSRGPALGLTLRHDRTEQTGRPSRGGVLTLKALRFFEQEEDYSGFWHLRGALEQFVGLWNSDQTLALRGVMSWIEPEGEAPVAFTRLLASENPDRMRGYDAGRWRDRGLALATAEYRWPVWAQREPGGLGVDALLFGELGQVFPHLDQLGDALKTSWGGGLRWIGGDGDFGASFTVGVSEEDTRFSLQFEQAFQYAKGGVYNGREACIVH